MSDYDWTKAPGWKSEDLQQAGAFIAARLAEQFADLGVSLAPGELRRIGRIAAVAACQSGHLVDLAAYSRAIETATSDGRRLLHDTLRAHSIDPQASAFTPWTVVALHTGSAAEQVRMAYTQEIDAWRCMTRLVTQPQVRQVVLISPNGGLRERVHGPAVASATYGPVPSNWWEVRDTE